MFSVVVMITTASSDKASVLTIGEAGLLALQSLTLQGATAQQGCGHHPR